MLAIGNIQLPVPFVQAALSGFSDLAMRRIARRMGAPYTLNEVVLDKLVVVKGRTRRETLSVPEDDHPVGGQLMGAEPEEFAAAAAEMVDAGYDVIDINFGCPVRKVLGRCRGGFHLSQPDVALDIVRRVIDAVGGRRPVTVKMRRGMDDSAEAEHNFLTILDGAYEAGAAAVTVHGRTVQQRYVGTSNWAFLATVKRHVGDRVLLGSGDLFTAEACMRMLNETGVDGVTIARGCIGNPWIFQDCRALYDGRPVPSPPTVPEQSRLIAEHFAEAVKVHGERRAGRIMRKFGIKYAQLHPMPQEVRDAFIAVTTPPEFQQVLDHWYDPSRTWPDAPMSSQPRDPIAAGATS